MTKRTRMPVITGVTQVQMEEAFGKYALAEAQISSINSQMEEAIVNIRKEGAAKISQLKEGQKEALQTLQVYAMENRDTLFAKKKSLETTHGTLGFRTGMPALKTRKGFTWAVVTELLQRNNPEYLRTTYEVAKDKLLADRDNKGIPELMDQIGVVVDQDETFFVECKKE